MSALVTAAGSHLLIGGTLAPGGSGVFATVNPATEEVLGHAANADAADMDAANADAADMDAAIAAARTAFDAGQWSRDHTFRARCLRQLRDALRGQPGAQGGDLAVMVGGSESAFDRVREPFGCFGGLVVHAGEVGAGTRMKLARNLLHFVAFTAAAEAQRLAEAAGLDITELGKVVRHSDAITGGPGAIMLRDTTAAVAPQDFWFPILSHVRDLGEKDLSLALALGERLNIELPLARMALDGLGAGLGVGSGDIAQERG